MAASSKLTRKTAQQWIGKPVYVELKDGRGYVGYVTGAENGQLLIAGRRSRTRPKVISSKRGGKALVSSFIPGMLGSMLGGGGSLFGGGTGTPAAAGAGTGAVGTGSAAGGFGMGLEGFMGFLGKALPMMKMGFGMIKTIMPLLKGFKA